MDRPRNPGEDILPRLWAAASRATGEERRLLLEAAKMIDTLRTLVGIRHEVELEDAEPEGNA